MLNLHMCEFCSTFVAKWRRRRNGLGAMNADERHWATDIPSLSSNPRDSRVVNKDKQ